MTGNNTISLNQKTMCIAIQTYLNEHVFTKEHLITVEDIELTTDNYTKLFNVTVKPVEPEHPSQT